MGFAYSNNGLSWRAVHDGIDLAPGEVLFAETPTDAQLAAAFPDFDPRAADAEKARRAAFAARAAAGAIFWQSIAGLSGDSVRADS